MSSNEHFYKEMYYEVGHVCDVYNMMLRLCISLSNNGENRIVREMFLGLNGDCNSCVMMIMAKLRGLRRLTSFFLRKCFLFQCGWKLSIQQLEGWFFC